MMARKEKNNQVMITRGFGIFKNIFCVLIFVMVVYPLYYVIIASISDPMSVAAGKVALWPKGLTFQGYKMVFEENELWIGIS